jgi:hypothetical protein
MMHRFKWLKIIVWLPGMVDVQILNSLPVAGFGEIRAFGADFFRNARIYTSRLEYFGAIWEGVKTEKPVKSTFYRLLSVFE